MADSRYDPYGGDGPPQHPFVDVPPPAPDVYPDGDAYDWFARGLELVESGTPASAVQLLQAAVDASPNSRMAREALARALFDSGDFVAAQQHFAEIVRVDPADDYAQFGLGLAAAKNGDLATSAEHLGYAAAIRPDITHYSTALRGARAALAAQR